MKKLSIAGVADKVESEGLDYAIQCYMSGEDIEDKKLAKLWDQARTILGKIEDILEAGRMEEEE